MAIKRALRLTLDKTISSAGLATLESDRVPAGEMWCLQHLSWLIDTALGGGNYRARLQVKQSAVLRPLEQQDDPEANELYTYEDEEWLGESEQITLELDQAAASTIARLWASGYRVDAKEGVV